MNRKGSRRGPAVAARASAALAILVAGCHRAALPWHEEAGFRWRELEARRKGPAAGFSRMPEARTGIRFANTASDSIVLGNRILAQGAGVALGDVDGDGLVDVFLASTQGPNVLYRNLGGWRFRDITDSAGVGAAGRYSTGAAFADIDGDGDLDLILLATTGPNAIFLNDGRGRFTEHGADLGLDPTGRGGTTVAMADVDGDGDLDLYVANYKPYTPIDSMSSEQRSFNRVVRQLGPNRFEVGPDHARDFKLVRREDMGGMVLSMRAEPDDFYLNEGGRFSHLSRTAGRFRDPEGRPLTQEEESFTLDARFADLNGDGAPDLYVVNDFEDTDQFWLNDGAGGFRRADWTVQRQISNSGMGVDVGDLNGDGLPDLFEVDMLSNDSRRLRTQIPTHTAIPKRPGDLETQLQQQRNTLFLNRGDGTFAEISAFAGVEASGWSWSTMVLDVDLDGWQDILIANGHVRDVMDGDTQERLQGGWDNIPWQRHFAQYPRLPLKNVAFRNRGDLTFEDVSARWGFGLEDDISHTMAAADLDGDGDLDVVINRLGAPALLLRNDAAAPRIAVRLLGEAPNTRAVGAKIRVLGGAVPVEEREVAVGGLYMSHSDYLASFATGSAAGVTIVVDWRDGRRSVFPGALPNRLYQITAATATGRVASDSVRDGSKPALFEDATSELRGHRHTEADYDDWSRQFLLPNALSQLGPGLAWFDLDRDGDDDLVIGAGKGGKIAVLRNENGRLFPDPAPGTTAENDYSSILGLVDGAGTRFLAGVSSWEARSPGEMLAIAPVLSIPVSGRKLSLPGVAVMAPDSSSTGPLALGDYDGDGDLDLFVGGRARPGRYPEPATSELFRNEGGRFIPDPGSAPDLARVGMVSAALFADVDGDGDSDLLLAREWGSILLLLNQGGRFAPAPDSWGLGYWRSRWNGLATGDLDGDGRLDLVATSWGRNTSFPTDSARPLTLLFGAFGSRGEEEMLLAREDPRLGALAPLNGFLQVRITLAGLGNRVRSFAEYANATAEQILGDFATLAERLTAVTLDQMMFLNRGDHFEARPLPSEAQFAPASYAGIADFDGDGFEDVFLSQNFYPTAVGLPRYDTGRSLLLAGDGKGGLSPMPGARSGLIVYGDQRGAAYTDMDGDGRLDLAVSQNGAQTRLFRNRGAKPGLRVRLAGPASNPDGVGAQIRIVYGQRMGPVREVQAGSGYWSQNGALQVMGLAGTPTAVWVRWPGGAESRLPVPDRASEVVVRR